MSNIKWFKLKGWEHKYRISRCGKIKNIITGNILYQGIDSGGYFSIRLFRTRKDGIRKRVHRLVAIQFLKNGNSLPQVNHKDGNKLNNNTSNLEWCTQLYNLHHYKNNPHLFKKDGCHSKSNGFFKSKKQIEYIKSKRKPVLQYSSDGIFIKEYKSVDYACKCLGIKTVSNIAASIAGRGRKKVAGFIWKFKSSPVVPKGVKLPEHPLLPNPSFLNE